MIIHADPAPIGGRAARSECSQLPGGEDQDTFELAVRDRRLGFLPGPHVDEAPRSGQGLRYLGDAQPSLGRTSHKSSRLCPRTDPIPTDTGTVPRAHDPVIPTVPTPTNARDGLEAKDQESSRATNTLLRKGYGHVRSYLTHVPGPAQLSLLVLAMGREIILWERWDGSYGGFKAGRRISLQELHRKPEDIVLFRPVW